MLLIRLRLRKERPQLGNTLPNSKTTDVAQIIIQDTAFERPKQSE